MTYQDMSFYSRLPSSFWPINYARRAPLLSVMHLAQAPHYYLCGFSHCGSPVCFSMCPPRRYPVLVRLNCIFFVSRHLNSRIAVLGVACFAFSQVPLWFSSKST